MKKLFEKNEIGFAILWIVIYVVGTSVADGLSDAVGVDKCVTFPFHLLLTVILLAFAFRNGLNKYFGLCKADASSARFLFFIPLAVLATCNLWNGFELTTSAVETALFILSMLCVGFLEEFIFRGLLFKAMSRSNITSAIIVSSLTFGIGHIVNLINGSGADLVSNLCQVCYAVAFGFMFVIIFHRGGSLLPCIITHSIINALSIFGTQIDSRSTVFLSAVITVICVMYTLIMLKTLPSAQKAQGEING